MRRVLFACALLCWPLSVQAEHSLKLHVALAAYMAAHGADLSATMYCLGAQTCREVNPVFAPLTRQPFVAGATKMGVAALSSWLLLRAHQRHPTLAFWLAVGGATVTSAVAVYTMTSGRHQ